jgi:hypothetical protein
MLGMKPTTLSSRLKKLNINPARFKTTPPESKAGNWSDQSSEFRGRPRPQEYE